MNNIVFVTTVNLDISIPVERYYMSCADYRFVCANNITALALVVNNSLNLTGARERETEGEREREREREREKEMERGGES